MIQRYRHNHRSIYLLARFALAIAILAQWDLTRVNKEVILSGIDYRTYPPNKFDATLHHQRLSHHDVLPVFS